MNKSELIKALSEQKKLHIDDAASICCAVHQAFRSCPETTC